MPAVQTDWDDFGIKYFNTDDDEFQDPSEGEDYVFDLRTGTDCRDAPTWDDEPGQIFINTDSTCGDDGAVDDDQGTRKVALRIALEGGGVYCQSN